MTDTQVSTARPYPFSPPDRLDLDPTYAQLRDTEPMIRVQLPFGEEAWLATRYADVRTVLGDPRFSRAADRRTRRAPHHPAAARGRHAAMDPPEHTRLRRLVARAFTARRVEQLRPRTRQIADELLTRMIGRRSPRPTWSPPSPPRCRSP